MSTSSGTSTPHGTTDAEAHEPAPRDGTGEHDTAGAYVTAGQEFRRDTNYSTTRITADGRDGYPVEPGRYRLVVSRACPWANRASIVRRLLGLEEVLSLGICGPTHDRRSWTFEIGRAHV